MKVAYITMQFPVPSETFASNDIRKLTGRGVEVSVHGLRPKHERFRELTVERGHDELEVTHNDFRASLRGLMTAQLRPLLALDTLAWLVRSTWRHPKHLLTSMLLFPRAFAILRELESLRPDVVHIYWGHYPAIVGYLVQRAMPRVATSLSLAAYDLTEAYGPTRAVARRCDFVRTLAEFNVPEVTRVAGVDREKVAVIHDGVDVVRLEETIAGTERIPRRVAVASRLIPSKDVAGAIHAFATTRRDWPDASLVVMGDGPERGRLESLCRQLGVEGSVQFLGHVSQERVAKELARSEVLLFTSRKQSERLPNVVKEAMLCGCICVVSETPGITELVRPNETGFVIGRDDMDAEDLLARIFSGEIDGQAVAVAARRDIRERFDLERMVDSYVERWQKAVRSRAGTLPSQPAFSGRPPSRSSLGAHR